MTQGPLHQQPTFKDVKARHEEFVSQSAEKSEINVPELRIFLDLIAQAGVTTEKAEERALLRSLIRYWSGFINDKTNEFPFVQLQPFDLSRISSKTRASSPQKSIVSSNPLMTPQNRRRMLTRLRSIWIDGILEQSLQNTYLINLILHDQPNHIENPWEAFQEIDASTRILPLDMNIAQIYDIADGELLILGEPGSGKTTLLLELARDLLNRASQEDAYPMPMIFNLSTWSEKRQPLTTWLIEELSRRYDVPNKLASLWIGTDQVIVLLDGLDEMPIASMEGCIEAINAYRHEHGLVPVVVCCRRTEYLAQKHRLILNRAVAIQPLIADQIDTYISYARNKTGIVMEELNHNSTLRELATTPLLLNILTLAYHGLSLKDGLEGVSPATLRHQIFAAYAERMLYRRGTTKHYTTKQTIHWLTWLAQEMMKHHQSEFYIEQIQPDWLSDSRLQTMYHFLVGLITGLLVGSIVGFIDTLVNGFSSGLLSGLAIGISSIPHRKLNAEIKPIETVSGRTPVTGEMVGS